MQYEPTIDLDAAHDPNMKQFPVEHEPIYSLRGVHQKANPRKLAESNLGVWYLAATCSNQAIK
jgi:hypothetical protein